MNMQPHEVATCLRQLADELTNGRTEFVTSCGEFEQRSNQLDSPEPAHPLVNILSLINDRGYTLEACLFNMVKRWDEGHSKWPVRIELQWQANIFQVPLDLLHDAIHAHPRLHAKYSLWPQSGYPYAD